MINEGSAMGKSLRTRRKSRKAVSLPVIPLKGDHGSATKIAVAGTFIEPILNDEGKNPNNMGRRRRVDRLSEIKLTMRQMQAGQYIRDAYCGVEMLSSGMELKERVQTQPRPDAIVVAQVDAMSLFADIMKAVPNNMRYVIEHVCIYNYPLSSLPKRSRYGSHSANLKVALDLVANKLKY